MAAVAGPRFSEATVTPSSVPLAVLSNILLEGASTGNYNIAGPTKAKIDNLVKAVSMIDSITGDDIRQFAFDMEKWLQVADLAKGYYADPAAREHMAELYKQLVALKGPRFFEKNFLQSLASRLPEAKDYILNFRQFTEAFMAVAIDMGQWVPGAGMTSGQVALLNAIKDFNGQVGRTEQESMESIINIIKLIVDSKPPLSIEEKFKGLSELTEKNITVTTEANENKQINVPLDELKKYVRDVDASDSESEKEESVVRKIDKENVSAFAEIKALKDPVKRDAKFKEVQNRLKTLETGPNIKLQNISGAVKIIYRKEVEPKTTEFFKMLGNVKTIKNKPVISNKVTTLKDYYKIISFAIEEIFNFSLVVSDTEKVETVNASFVNMNNRYSEINQETINIAAQLDAWEVALRGLITLHNREFALFNTSVQQIPVQARPSLTKQQFKQQYELNKRILDRIEELDKKFKKVNYVVKINSLRNDYQQLMKNFNDNKNNYETTIQGTLPIPEFVYFDETLTKIKEHIDNLKGLVSSEKDKEIETRINKLDKKYAKLSELKNAVASLAIRRNKALDLTNQAIANLTPIINANTIIPLLDRADRTRDYLTTQQIDYQALKNQLKNSYSTADGILSNPIAMLKGLGIAAGLKDAAVKAAPVVAGVEKAVANARDEIQKEAAQRAAVRVNAGLEQAAVNARDEIQKEAAQREAARVNAEKNVGLEKAIVNAREEIQKEAAHREAVRADAERAPVIDLLRRNIEETQNQLQESETRRHEYERERQQHIDNLREVEAKIARPQDFPLEDPLNLEVRLERERKLILEYRTLINGLNDEIAALQRTIVDLNGQLVGLQQNAGAILLSISESSKEYMKRLRTLFLASGNINTGTIPQRMFQDSLIRYAAPIYKPQFPKKYRDFLSNIDGPPWAQLLSAYTTYNGNKNPATYGPFINLYVADLMT